MAPKHSPSPLPGCHAILRHESDHDVIDLTDVHDLPSARAAHLVLMRRDRLAYGRDLRIAGLHGQARAAYQLYRLEHVLPEVAPVG